MNRGNIGFLPAISVGTASVFFVVLAASHDIARGEGFLLEYGLLALSAPAAVFLYRAALSRLTRRERIAWLSGAGLLLVLLAAGAASVRMRPKYPLDPVLATGMLFAVVPATTAIGYRVVREIASVTPDQRNLGPVQ